MQTDESTKCSVQSVSRLHNPWLAKGFLIVHNNESSLRQGRVFAYFFIHYFALLLAQNIFALRVMRLMAQSPNTGLFCNLLVSTTELRLIWMVDVYEKLATKNTTNNRARAPTACFADASST